MKFFQIASGDASTVFALDADGQIWRANLLGHGLEGDKWRWKKLPNPVEPISEPPTVELFRDDEFTHERSLYEA